MFGGLGIYSGELFFALVDDDVLYFKWTTPIVLTSWVEGCSLSGPTETKAR
jgi:TfoX/Sxy family transcriptional regulator of competence genes